MPDLENLLEQASATRSAGRVRPHFLFNALNIIARLIDAGRPTDANRAVLALATILRYEFETPDELTLLLDELRVVEAYATIQKFRFGDRLTLEISIPPDMTRVPIPPGCVLNLVENAFEAIETKVGPGRVILSATADNGYLMIEVTDAGTRAVGRVTVPLKELRRTGQ